MHPGCDFLAQVTAFFFRTLARFLPFPFLSQPRFSFVIGISYLVRWLLPSGSTLRHSGQSKRLPGPLGTCYRSPSPAEGDKFYGPPLTRRAISLGWGPVA